MQAEWALHAALSTPAVGGYEAGARRAGTGIY